MDVNKYLEKWVKIDLNNGFYYEGLVIGVDKDSISLKDKKGTFVDISIKTISFIRECER